MKLRFPADHRHCNVAYVNTSFPREDELSKNRGRSDWFNVLDITPEGVGSLAFTLITKDETHVFQHKRIYFLVNIVLGKDIMS